MLQCKVSESALINENEAAPGEPLLFEKRQYLPVLDASSGSTTSCQTTFSPVDYGPDD